VTSTPFLLFFMLLLAATLAWLLRPGHRKGEGGGEDSVEDPEMLEEAERELEDLDAFSTPEDAEQDLPDWGPGAPKA
jgi:hypothetical protein